MVGRITKLSLILALATAGGFGGFSGGIGSGTPEENSTGNAHDRGYESGRHARTPPTDFLGDILAQELEPFALGAVVYEAEERSTTGNPSEFRAGYIKGLRELLEVTPGEVAPVLMDNLTTLQTEEGLTGFRRGLALGGHLGYTIQSIVRDLSRVLAPNKDRQGYELGVTATLAQACGAIIPYNHIPKTFAEHGALREGLSAKPREIKEAVIPATVSSFKRPRYGIDDYRFESINVPQRSPIFSPESGNLREEQIYKTGLRLYLASEGITRITVDQIRNPETLRGFTEELARDVASWGDQETAVDYSWRPDYTCSREATIQNKPETRIDIAEEGPRYIYERVDKGLRLDEPSRIKPFRIPDLTNKPYAALIAETARRGRLPTEPISAYQRGVDFALIVKSHRVLDATEKIELNR